MTATAEAATKIARDLTPLLAQMEQDMIAAQICGDDLHDIAHAAKFLLVTIERAARRLGE